MKKAEDAVCTLTNCMCKPVALTMGATSVFNGWVYGLIVKASGAQAPMTCNQDFRRSNRRELADTASPQN